MDWRFLRNAGGPVSVPTTISTMTQAVTPTALAYVAKGYTAPSAKVPPTATSTIAITRRVRGRHEGFAAAPPAAGGTYVQRTTTKTTTVNAHVENDYMIFNNSNMCFSCGSDVPMWSTTMVCPAECRVPGHQVSSVGRTPTCEVAPDHAQYVATG